MKKKVCSTVLLLILVILGIVVFKFNVYDTQFCSIFFWDAKVHTPTELEKVS